MNFLSIKLTTSARLACQISSLSFIDSMQAARSEELKTPHLQAAIDGIEGLLEPAMKRLRTGDSSRLVHIACRMGDLAKVYSP